MPDDVPGPGPGGSEDPGREEPAPATGEGSAEGSAGPVSVGLISDTHGLLRPEVFEALRGVSHVVHAGDVGDPGILADLAALAPVTAVWGNVDAPEVRSACPETAETTLGGCRVAVAHGHQVAPEYERLVARFPRARVVVHGHTHEPSRSRVGGVLLLNPGSAGPKRFGKPVTVMRLGLAGDGELETELVDLEAGG